MASTRDYSATQASCGHWLNVPNPASTEYTQTWAKAGSACVLSMALLGPGGASALGALTRLAKLGRPVPSDYHCVRSILQHADPNPCHHR